MSFVPTNQRLISLLGGSGIRIMPIQCAFMISLCIFRSIIVNIFLLFWSPHLQSVGISALLLLLIIADIDLFKTLHPANLWYVFRVRSEVNCKRGNFDGALSVRCWMWCWVFVSWICWFSELICLFDVLLYYLSLKSPWWMDFDYFFALGLWIPSIWILILRWDRRALNIYLRYRKNCLNLLLKL